MGRTERKALKMKRRWIAWLLALTLLCTLLPAADLAKAEEAAPPAPDAVENGEPAPQAPAPAENDEATPPESASEGTDRADRPEEAEQPEEVSAGIGGTGGTEQVPGQPTGLIPMEYHGGRAITDAYLRGDRETVDRLTRGESRTGLAASYDSRNYGYITMVKNQDPYATCWSFATMAPIEAYMIKHGIRNADTGKPAATTINLSETHLCWFAFTKAYDELFMISGDRTAPDLSAVGASSYLDVGGNGAMATFTLMRGEGPAPETISALQYSHASTSGLAGSYAYRYNTARVTDADWIPTSNRDAVKRAIVEYGAGTINYFHNDAYYNASTAAYCFKQTAAYGSLNFCYTNHAVTVVGWDDNYSRTNFNTACRPASNGAWICKNSWGASWGKSGYFYLSYEDSASYEDICFFYKASDLADYDYCYQYDGTTNTVNYQSMNNNSMVANVFTARGVEDLKAVAIAPWDEATSYTLKIYKDPQPDNPASGTLVASRQGCFEYAGYHTVELEQPVQLSAGDRFSVVFTLSTPEPDPGDSFYLHIPYDATGRNSFCTWTHKDNGDTSFYKEPGGAWTDCPNLGDFRIKAFTEKAGAFLEVEVRMDDGSEAMSNCATMDVWLNGTKAVNDAYFFSQELRRGTTYTIDDIRLLGNGTCFAYVDGDLSGTVQVEDVHVFLVFSKRPPDGFLTVSAQELVLQPGQSGTVDCIVSDMITDPWELRVETASPAGDGVIDWTLMSQTGQTVPLKITANRYGGVCMKITLAYQGSVDSIDCTYVTVKIDRPIDPPSITAQPKSTEVRRGGTATFSVSAVGENLRYQWQYKKAGQSAWTNWSGKTTASVSCTVGDANNGCRYRCVVSNKGGSVTSETVLLTMITAPAITAQPKSVSVKQGGTAVFTVAASGGALSYQWQYKKIGQSAWTNWSGKTSASAKCTAGTSNDGCQYRCVVKNVEGSVTSEIATLSTVCSAPVLTVQPTDTAVAKGGTAAFAVAASGGGLSWQWQYKKVGQSDWTDWAGKTEANVTCTAGTSNDGCLYRCVVTNLLGTVTSETATLTTVYSAPKITAQPKSVTVDRGTAVTFTAAASGEALSWQWQYKKAGQSNWTNWAGKTEASVSCTAGYSNDGCLYRCVVTNVKGSVTSEAAKLTSIDIPIITAQPRDTTVVRGGTASFTVSATGNGLSWQWQYKKVGQADWTDWAGKTEATVACTAGSANDGCQYRCVVSNANRSVTSAVAVLTTVLSAPSVTAQPQDAAVARGSTATFTVDAAGNGLSWQWQYKKVGESGWTDWSGKTKPTVTCTAGSANDGCQYRCVVSNALGSATSAVAVLTTVYSAPQITGQPKAVSVTRGSTATFTVAASGEGLSWQWQYKKVGEAAWTDWSGKTKPTVTCTAGSANDGCQYRCVVTNALGSVTSAVAVLTTVYSAPQITTQPKSVSVTKGSTATFTVAASGEGLSWQWQYKKVGEADWTNWSGKTAPTAKCTAGVSNNGCQYRCVVTNAKGSVTSAVAILTTLEP